MSYADEVEGNAVSQKDIVNKFSRVNMLESCTLADAVLTILIVSIPNK